jgi:hypothetical protein
VLNAHQWGFKYGFADKMGEYKRIDYDGCKSVEVMRKLEREVDSMELAQVN